jgi:hypothetical protein
VEELEQVWVCCGWRTPDAVDTVECAPDDGWKYHPKHVEQFPHINKLCNVASCWIYEYIGILLGAHLILHISRIRVNWYAYFAFFIVSFCLTQKFQKLILILLLGSGTKLSLVGQLFSDNSNYQTARVIARAFTWRRQRNQLEMLWFLAKLRRRNTPNTYSS